MRSQTLIIATSRIIHQPDVTLACQIDANGALLTSVRHVFAQLPLARSSDMFRRSQKA
jgi:hypothetical protein